MKIGDPSGPCPRCKAPTTLYDFIEVDIGVGVQTFDHQYLCPECGEFAFVTEGVVFREEETKS